MMIPFSLQCIKCGEYMYRGKKFNSRKEDVVGDTYLGIRKYRFYIKCCVCSNEIAFKTDPQNQDYVCESGATRNFESWRQQDDKEKEFEDERNQSSEQNAMAALESRTLDSKIEMDILDALDEIKAYNERHERVDRADLGRRDGDGDGGGQGAGLSGAEQAELEAFQRAQKLAKSAQRGAEKPPSAFAAENARHVASSSEDDFAGGAGAAAAAAAGAAPKGRGRKGKQVPGA